MSSGARRHSVPSCRQGQFESSGGFTLIELMVVIAILGILAALVAPSIIGRKEDAMRAAAKTQIKNFEQALKLFYVDNGFYPSTEQGLNALVEKPSIGRIPARWREGGYLESKTVPKDPWGHPYVYISPGIHNRDFDIISYGADGQEGGEGKDADIQSWALEEN
ncbi:MAG: type II secretion system major pseudopilin GspG [bacterium]